MNALFRACRSCGLLGCRLPPVLPKAAAVIAVFALALIGTARADTILNLSGATQTVGGVDIPSTNTGTINGAIFRVATVDDKPTAGTGNLDPFLRMCGGNAGVCWGFNTSASALDSGLDPKIDITLGSDFTTDLLLSSLQATFEGGDGIEYYKFLLDLNEQGGRSGGGLLMSIDTVKIFQSSTGGITAPPTGTPVYTTEPNAVIVIDSTGSGGVAEMAMLVPTSAFDLSLTNGTPTKNFVYLYAEFGGLGGDGSVFEEDNGHEEWAALTSIGGGGEPPTPIPEPRTFLLIGIGIIALAAFGRHARNA